MVHKFLTEENMDEFSVKFVTSWKRITIFSWNILFLGIWRLTWAYHYNLSIYNKRSARKAQLSPLWVLFSMLYNTAILFFLLNNITPFQLNVQVRISCKKGVFYTFAVIEMPTHKRKEI